MKDNLIFINTTRLFKIKLAGIKLLCIVSLFCNYFIVAQAQSGNSNQDMIDLPPLPKVDINTQDKAMDKIMQDALKVKDQADKTDDEKLKNFIPWRDGFGDPRDPHFQKLLKSQFPMSPDQIKIFRETLNIYEQAMQDQVRNPTPIMSTRSVNLDPGGSPPAVRISTGYVSSVLFVDETGAPWPIKAYDIGNSKAFNVVWDQKGNILMIQGLVPYSNTNIVVLLHGLDTPVILNLINDQKKVDYRLDLRVQGMGPQATVPIITNTEIPEGDDLLMGLIDGLPPEQARPLEVQGGNAQAWIMNDEELLIRTRLTILSPSYTSSMRSPDGMKVYRMPKTPLIMATKDGNTYKLAVNGY